MSTPILTHEQQRRTLSAKKGPIKGLRNVLAQPYENYWPVLKNDENGALQKLLRELLQPLHQTKATVPWSQLRKMKREERLAVKNSVPKNDEITLLRKTIITGINAVTRGLEKKNLCSVLLDSNVETIIIKHIVTMAENDNIPVVLIPFLKTVTLETIGFASAAFALKNDIKDLVDHHFHPLYNKILELSSSFVRPKILVKQFSEEVSDEVSNKNSETENNNIEVENSNLKTAKAFVLSSNVYLYRSSCKERVFIPEGANTGLQLPSSSKQWGDFIPLGKDTEFVSSSDNSPYKKSGRNIKAKRYMDFRDESSESCEKIPFQVKSGESADLTTNSARIKDCNNEISDTKESGNKSKKIKRSATANCTYIPLKVKRMQGNSVRAKSRKVSKSKKK